MTPAVVATCTWPRTTVERLGIVGVETADVGLDVERTSTPSAAPARRHPAADPPSREPATWSPSSSQRLTIRRFPTTCPCISPSPAKRCWSTCDQVWPHSSSPHSAASAIRRSPGGSTPNSPRSRPDEPPLSATVTTAVTSEATWRSAAQRAHADRAHRRARRRMRWLCSTASLPPEVAVRGAASIALGREPTRRSPRSSRRCGACRRCTRSRSVMKRLPSRR